ncbi:hypothetical protein [Robiginitalea sp. SC105]|uniref:hypothetical protein n=1 Tax=Robiginitalea sp. SC105 TaxID=2762332 RepID=UPI00163975E2|nr:hypothetical protein [Robiginitalea sp. SC105]MBC2839866.1 hypothetical protein [Robiginitalea sp. SC105]
MNSNLKLQILFFVASALIMQGCSKEDDLNYREFKVTDFVTGEPIEGALVLLNGLETLPFGSGLGYHPLEPHFKLYTDNNGSVSLQTHLYEDGWYIGTWISGYYRFIRKKENNITDSHMLGQSINYSPHEPLNFAFTSHSYYEIYEGRETEIELLPVAGMAIILLANTENPNTNRIILQGCYEEHNKQYCFEKRVPTDSGNITDTYGPIVYNDIIVDNDTIVTRGGIGDLSIQLEILYLDWDDKLIKTQDAGEFFTPRNTVTEITIQLE